MINEPGICPKCNKASWYGSGGHHISCGYCGWISRNNCPKCGRWHWREDILNQQGTCMACNYVQICTPKDSYEVK